MYYMKAVLTNCSKVKILRLPKLCGSFVSPLTSFVLVMLDGFRFLSLALPPRETPSINLQDALAVTVCKVALRGRRRIVAHPPFHLLNLSVALVYL